MTFCVLNEDKLSFFKPEQLQNIYAILVTLTVLNEDKSSSAKVEHDSSVIVFLLLYSIEVILPLQT